MTWDNNWSTKFIESQLVQMYPGELGDGRNDGINRIYLPDLVYPRVLECTWNDVANRYDKNYIYSDGNLHFERLIVGDARNDGVNRLYVSEGIETQPGNGSLVEMEFGGDNNWNQENIFQASSTYYMRFEMVISKTHTDNKNRLYSLVREGALVEHEYNNNGNWDETEIDAISSATASLAIGDVHNDGINRIYTAGESGFIYEYTHPDNVSIGDESNFVIDKKSELKGNYPNPFNPTTEIEYTIKKSENVILSIYNSKGEKISELINQRQTKGNYNVQFDAESLTSGIYFCILNVGGKEAGRKKMILVR